MVGHNFESENVQFVLLGDRIDNILELLHHTVYEDTFTVFWYPNEVIIAEILRVPCRAVVLILHTVNSMDEDIYITFDIL